MFELRRLEVVHWDYWQRFTLPLDSSIVTVVGPNGSGKTTLLDGLRTLLAIECSVGRDYKRYVRHSQKTFAWLRAVVGNLRSADGRYPFFPLMDDHVTLACRIQKKGGDWLRQYSIAPGDASIEMLAENAKWLGVAEYRAQLEGAGLTRAIKRVLSLEQGDTDKLCEYSPKQLLELVFSVFGDQETLDNYQRAKTEQQEIGHEIDTLEVELAGLAARLHAADAEVNSYREWRGLKDELIALEAEWRPRVELAELREAIQGGRNQLIGRRRELSSRQKECEVLARRRDALVQAIASARAEEAQCAAAVANAQELAQAARDKARDGEGLLAERDRLGRLARAQAEALDVAALVRDVETARQHLAQVQNAQADARTRTEELAVRLSAWRSGCNVEPTFVTEYRDALQQVGIRHCLLAEIVEVIDGAWQGAVEAALAPFRHVVLLENSDDRRMAWELGERLHYRHFVVPERDAPPATVPDSLREVVRFTADPPAWLAAYLNGIRRVGGIAEGGRLPEHEAWITPGGYYREQRGGRYMGVEPRDYRFGDAARRRLIEEAEQEQQNMSAELARLEKQAAVLSAGIGETLSLLNGVEAARDLASRAPEFVHVERELPRWQTEAHAAEEELKRRKEAEGAATEQRHQLEIEQSEVNGELKRISNDIADWRQELDGQRNEQRARIQAFREKRRLVPESWRTRKALAQAKSRYESPAAIQRDIERLNKRLQEGTWIMDEIVIPKREKLRADHMRLESTITGRRVHHERAMDITNRARGSYINVLRATVRQYAKNLRTLGSLAGIDVDVEPPHLENDDLVLAQAGLAVKFDFDQKGFIGLNDGEASGGQQVMKSLILLVGLMMDEARPGGFVFVDEPFAHLDIFNIDKVGAFLEATRAQYILTTPNTHNVNVFKPSDLTLVTAKRRPSAHWAPPVAFLRRDRTADRGVNAMTTDRAN